MVNSLVLCSGGLDSVTAAFLVKQSVRPKKMVLLFVDYGQRSLKSELSCVRNAAKILKADLQIVKAPWLGNWSTSFINKKQKFPVTSSADLEDRKKETAQVAAWYVPARNGLFTFIALSLAESLSIKEKAEYNIVLGIKREGEICFKDSRPQFVSAMNLAAKEATMSGNITIVAPLMEYDKDEVVSLAQKLRVPLEKTVSCYVSSSLKNNIPIHCGTCSNCAQRKAAFYWANVKDPSVYRKER